MQETTSQDQLFLPYAADTTVGQQAPRRGSPLPMQYLGSKARLTTQLIGNIRKAFPSCTTFVDLFAGTGVVSLAASADGYQVIANDIQPYSYAVLKSLLCANRDGLLGVSTELAESSTDAALLARDRHSFTKSLREERGLLAEYKTGNLDWKQYKTFCEATEVVSGDPLEISALRKKRGWNLFCRYYLNTYFGVEQCLQLDMIREWAESLPKAHKDHVIAATVSAMTYCVSSTTHLAQFLKPQSKKSVDALIARRSMSIVGEVRKRLLSLQQMSIHTPCGKAFHMDCIDALEHIELDDSATVYVDPPYFKEHYSRYYHVLDTFCLYDYPELTSNPRIGGTTIGRYRKERLTSSFGKRALVKDAFKALLSRCKAIGASVAISYANTSLIPKDKLLLICRKAGYSPSVVDFTLMHSGQGKPRHRKVTEHLFLLAPK